MTKIEEIVAALREAPHFGLWGDNWAVVSPDEEGVISTHQTMQEAQIVECQHAALAVLRAIREPTGGMGKAGRKAFTDEYGAWPTLKEIGTAYTAMIDHIIQEGKT
jgi:hypothetical protein